MILLETRKYIMSICLFYRRWDLWSLSNTPMWSDCTRWALIVLCINILGNIWCIGGRGVGGLPIWQWQGFECSCQCNPWCSKSCQGQRSEKSNQQNEENLTCVNWRVHPEISLTGCKNSPFNAIRIFTLPGSDYPCYVQARGKNIESHCLRRSWRDHALPVPNLGDRHPD